MFVIMHSSVEWSPPMQDARTEQLKFELEKKDEEIAQLKKTISQCEVRWTPYLEVAKEQRQNPFLLGLY